MVYEVLGYNSSGQWLGGYSNGVADTDWYDVLYKKAVSHSSIMLVQVVVVIALSTMYLVAFIIRMVC